MTEEDALDRRRFRAGDPGVFRVAVDRYSPRLLPVLRAYAADGDEAHDLLQDVWRRAYDKRHSFIGRGTLFGWLLAIARTVGLKHVERQRSRERFVLDPEDHMGTPRPDPARAAEQEELARHVRRALVELPDREREVVILRLLEQRSTRETAALLGCAEGTVKASLHSALEKLRTPMEVWAG